MVSIPYIPEGTSYHKPSIPVWEMVPHQCDIVCSSENQLSKHTRDTRASLTQYPSLDQSPTNPVSQWGPVHHGLSTPKRDHFPTGC